MTTLDTRSTLEAELLVEWNDRTGAIYADHLQSIGDPRGELIMLDLRGAGPAADQRRGELLRAWLGLDARIWWDEAHGTWYAGDPETTWITFERGLVDILFLGPPAWRSTGGLVRFLDGAGGYFVHRFSVSGECDTVRACLRALSRRPQPWLRHLAIRRLDHDGELLVDEALQQQLLDATPRLDLLDVSGPQVFGRFVHPTVRELRVLGHDALALAQGPAMPAVRVVDFAYDDANPPPYGGRGELPPLLSRDRFPNVRQLRLWREEPGGRVLPVLHDVDLLPQLGQLTLPSLRSGRDVANVQRALDRMPMLRTLEIARAYAVVGNLGRDLRHASAKIKLPPLHPWPPAEHVIGGRMLGIDDVRVDVHEAIELMEEQYDDLPPDQRGAWDQVWSTLDQLGWGRDTNGIQAIPLGVLARALDGLDQLDEYAGWAALRVWVRARGPTAIATASATLQWRYGRAGA